MYLGVLLIGFYVVVEKKDIQREFDIQNHSPQPERVSINGECSEMRHFKSIVKITTGRYLFVK